MSFDTFNLATGLTTDCEIVVWLAIKAANNANQLQQTTLRFKGSGMKSINVARNGEGFMVVQTKNPSAFCAVTSSAAVTEDS